MHGLTHIPLIKLTPQFNHKPVPIDPSLLDVERMEGCLCNQTWLDFETMTPKFEGCELEYIGEYRSSFGMFILKNATMPGSGPDECKTALARMIALRRPLQDGYSDRLASNQDTLSVVFEKELAEFVAFLSEEWHERNPEALLPAWVFAKHPKRELRVKTNAITTQCGHANFDDDKPVDFKLKFGELLESGKKRGIGDLGVFRTQKSACVIPAIKQSWSRKKVYGSVCTEFVMGPEKDKMRQVFKDLLEPGDEIHFKYHSDDSCVGATCKDGVVYFNGDIVKCDGSHRTPMLKLLEECFERAQGFDGIGNEYLANAFRELYKPLRFKYKSKKKELQIQQIIIYFLTGRLYSGSALTTLINNFANLLIAFALAKRVPNPRELSKAEMLEAYVLAGEDVGYELKVGVCECIEDLQFLKCSPSRIVCGVDKYPEGYCYEPWMGLGVHVRGFGTFKGDLPGAGSVEERAAAFLSGVVEGRRLWGDHEFYDAFRAAYKIDSRKEMKMSRYKAVSALLDVDNSKLLGESLGRISALSVCNRYKITLVEYERVCRIVNNSGPFFVMRDPVFDIFYDKDYG